MLAAIIMGPNCSALWFSLTVISTWNIGTKKSWTNTLVLRGIFQKVRWKNKGVVKIGKCDRNIVLWNLNWIKKNEKTREVCRIMRK